MLDPGATPTVLAWTPVSPDGALVYEARGSGTLSGAGDADVYEVAVAAGQVLTAVAEAGGATLVPTLTVRDAGGAVVGTAAGLGAGKGAVTAGIPTATAGVYRVWVGASAGSGAYAFRAQLNADEELEAQGGAANDTPAAAQSLAGAFAVLPGAAGVTRAAVRGRFRGADAADVYAVPVQAGQRVSAVLQATAGLAAAVELLDGSLGRVALGTADVAGVGRADAVAPAAATWYLKVTGAANANYALAVVRGGWLERESNATVATAQAVGSAFTVLGSAARVPPPAVVLAADEFPTSTLSGAWTTYASDPARGRATPANGVGPDNTYALIMQVVKAGYNLNEAVWTVDLAGARSPVLSFWHRSFGDELHPLEPGDLQGHVPGGGVLVSDDGVNWVPVWTPPADINSPWTRYTVDLGSVAVPAGLKFGPDFRVKFQQYDDEVPLGDARGWDSVRIDDRAPDWDTYVVAGAAGGELHLSAAPVAVAGGAAVNSLDPLIELYDPSGALVAIDDNGAADGRGADLHHLLRATGDYRVVVRGSGAATGEYVLTGAVSADDGSPAAPDLLPVSDAGPLSVDNLTNLNNASPATALRFLVGRTAFGETITLYADGVPVASTLAPGSETWVTTDGVAALGDGRHLFSATRRAPGQPESARGAAAAVVIDTVAPTNVPAVRLRPSSDTGPGDSDGITADTTPTLMVSGLSPAGYYQLFRDGAAETPSPVSAETYTPAGLANGTYRFTARAVDAAGNEAAAGTELAVLVDTTSPAVTAAAFDRDAPAHHLRFTFGEDVSAALADGTLVLRNLSTGGTIDPAAARVRFTAATLTADFSFPGLPGGALPEGRYAATLGGTALADPAGNALEPFEFSFVHLAADATGDGVVDAADLRRLYRNLGKSPATYADGDLDGDGRVTFADYQVLEPAFGRSLPAAPAPAPAAAATRDQPAPSEPAVDLAPAPTAQVPAPAAGQQAGPAAVAPNPLAGNLHVPAESPAAEPAQPLGSEVVSAATRADDRAVPARRPASVARPAPAAPAAPRRSGFGTARIRGTAAEVTGR